MERQNLLYKHKVICIIFGFLLQLKEAYQSCSEENAENKQALLAAHRKDEKSSQMLNELTAVSYTG